jgi:hypothetical protein
MLYLRAYIVFMYLGAPMGAFLEDSKRNKYIHVCGRELVMTVGLQLSALIY